jgi:transcriptional regulator with XRE-family HTH domain
MNSTKRKSSLEPSRSGRLDVAPEPGSDWPAESLDTALEVGLTERHSETELVQIKRFIKAISQALVSNGFSQRDLCERLGISVGTLTKYLRGAVAPMRVGLGIQRGLAEQLGVTVDALATYYTDGEYATAVTLDDVASWIRSDAGQKDLPQIMASLQEAGQRWIGICGGKAPARYDWPKQELDRLKIPAAVRGRLGLTDEALELLTTGGGYSEEVAEGFAALIGVSTTRARKAFDAREIIPE